MMEYFTVSIQIQVHETFRPIFDMVFPLVIEKYQQQTFEHCWTANIFHSPNECLSNVIASHVAQVMT